MSKEDNAKKPKKRPRKDKKPKKVKTTTKLVPDSPAREFEMNQPSEEEDLDEDEIA